jgi:hypothetical protein
MLSRKTLFLSQPWLLLFSIIGSPDHGRYPWKKNIVTTVFWIGERATRNNPVPNTKSAWDLRWGRHYGGYDNPTDRANYIPVRFIPNQNPFYVALPYNDVNHNRSLAVYFRQRTPSSQPQSQRRLRCQPRRARLSGYVRYRCVRLEVCSSRGRSERALGIVR